VAEGIAGAGANTEYTRRLAQHKERVRRRRPWVLAAAAAFGGVGIVVLGSGSSIGWIFVALGVSLLVGLVETPQSITAWRTGGDGEARTAAFLAPLVAGGYRILHDRRIPGSRANIDHICIGPSGIYVIETKSVAGRVSIRGDDVYLNGRRRAWVDEVRREVEAVERALAVELAVPEIHVRPIICVHRADLPLFSSRAGGIPLLTGKELLKHLGSGPPVLGSDAIARLADLVEARLPAR
jgi:hypothetical protein